MYRGTKKKDLRLVILPEYLEEENPKLYEGIFLQLWTEKGS